VKNVHCLYFREKIFWFPYRVRVPSPFHQVLEFPSHTSTVKDLFDFPFLLFINDNRWGWSGNLARERIVGYEM